MVVVWSMSYSSLHLSLLESQATSELAHLHMVVVWSMSYSSLHFSLPESQAKPEWAHLHMVLILVHLVF